MSIWIEPILIGDDEPSMARAHDALDRLGYPLVPTAHLDAGTPALDAMGAVSRARANLLVLAVRSSERILEIAEQITSKLREPHAVVFYPRLGSAGDVDQLAALESQGAPALFVPLRPWRMQVPHISADRLRSADQIELRNLREATLTPIQAQRRPEAVLVRTLGESLDLLLALRGGEPKVTKCIHRRDNSDIEFVGRLLVSNPQRPDTEVSFEAGYTVGAPKRDITFTIGRSEATIAPVGDRLSVQETDLPLGPRFGPSDVDAEAELLGLTSQALAAGLRHGAGPAPGMPPLPTLTSEGQVLAAIDAALALAGDEG